MLGVPDEPSEKDAKLAQKLGQLQPFLAVFPQELHWPTGIFWANLTPLSLQLARLNLTEESAAAGSSTRRMLRKGSGSSSGTSSGTASGADGGGDDVAAAGATSSAANGTDNGCTCEPDYFNTSRGVKCHSGNYARSQYAFECTTCDELDCVTTCSGEVLNCPGPPRAVKRP